MRPASLPMRVALALTFALLAAAPATAATVRDGLARFDVLSPTLIRLQYAADGRFENRPTMTAVDRTPRAPRATSTVRGAQVVIRTPVLTLRYTRASGPFSALNLALTLRIGGRRVTVHPAPGPAVRPLGGWRRSLDLADGPVALHDGLLSRAGWRMLDDSATVLLTQAAPGFAVRPAHQGAYQDLYLFGFGHDYARGLRDLRDLAGPAPLLPRKAFGVWFSRYWPYGDKELRDLIARFRTEKVPLDTLSIDTDFKHVNDPAGAAVAAVAAGAPGQPFSWNGWEWNSDKFNDPARFLSWAHGEGLAVTLNVHPSIDSRDPRFAETQARAGGALKADDGCRVLQADPTGSCTVFDWTDPRQLDAYFALHAPFERDGVDFWWLDWCCDASRAVAPGLTADTWINSRYAERQRARGQRWPAFQRIGGSFQQGFGGDGGMGAFAEHRQTIQFTGDTCGTWAMLGFEAQFTADEGSIGLPYVSHDIGSFHSSSPLGVCDSTLSALLTPEINSLPPQLYARWVQLGTFQPLDRLHSHHGKRLPWEYPGKAGTVAAAFLRLREALVPYLYTAARQTHDSGVPMVRALYLRWPEQDDAYRHGGEFMLGRDLLVAPVSAPGDPAPVTVWIPPGAWTDLFTGEHHRGPATLRMSVPLERMPVFVRSGAIVPSQGPVPTTVATSPAALVLTAYPGSGRSELYDDAGDGLAYEHGRFARTPLTQRRTRDALVLRIGAARGRFPGRAARRRYELHLLGLRRPQAVTVAGRQATWRYDAELGAVTVRTRALPTSRDVRVVVR